eukprot:386181_1
MPPKPSGGGKDPEDVFQRAADAIWNTEYLLIVAGPGFLEESTAHMPSKELSDPLLVSNPNKFFGIWGKLFNRYAERTPHEGFYLLRKWRDSYFDAMGEDGRKRG